MNLLEEIQNAPVEWKELGEVAVLKRGKTITAKTIVEGNYPVISGGQKPAYYHGEFNQEGESITVAGSGAYAGFVMYWNEPIFVSDAFSIKPDKEVLNTRYVYHFLLENQFRIYQMKTGSGIPHVYAKDVAKIKIPIPPLEIQEKIVQTLDKFTDYVTELTSELTSELTLRQKQYSYFRDYLLNFEDDSYKVEWKSLGEIGAVSMCRRIMKEQTSSTGEIPFYKIGTFGKKPDSFISKELFLEYKEKYSYPKVGEVLISASGTIGRTVIFDGEPAYFQDSNIVWLSHDETIVLNKYLFYIYQLQPWQVATGSTIKRLYNDNLKKTKIPIPPLSVQEKIVHVLDNFDTVCNDLNIGLPKEIELRQKQYEYFRDQLLTYTAEGVYTDSTVQYRQDLIRLLWYVFGPIKVTFGAISDLSRGKRVVKSQLSENKGYPVYQNSLRPLGFYSESNRQAKQSIIICAGAAGDIAFIDVDFWAADDAYTLTTEVEISDKFLYYVLLSKQSIIKSKVRKASIPRLSKTHLERIEFYLPPLEEQERIVSILDKFDTLTSDLSQGLPKEIALRQKEYEYWRDCLLTFN